MLVMCDSVGSELGIKYNPSKSKCIKIGPLHNIQPSTLLLGSTELPWVQEFEYLGICLKSTKSFQVDLSNIRRKFFTSVNSILSKCSHTSDLVKLFLLESHCLPILIYTVESLHLPASQLNEINRAGGIARSEEHTSELQSLAYLVCRLLLEKKKKKNTAPYQP